jgi:hypothetical protein
MIGSAAAEPIVFWETMTMSVAHETRIGDLFVAKGLVNENQVAGALRLQR